MHDWYLYLYLHLLTRWMLPLHSGGYYSNYLDLTSEYAGALSGFGNTFATGQPNIRPHAAG